MRPGPHHGAPALTVPSTDGVTIAVHDLGGDGPPILLAHATGFHGRVWAPLARHLSAATGARCWAPDLRGHGDSEVPDDHAFGWSGFADDVLAVVDALGLTDVRAAGHSKGGAALLLAEQRRPGTFAALYCFEPVVFPPPTPAQVDLENPLAEGALRRRDAFASFDAAYDNFRAKPPFDTLDPEALRAYVDGGFREEPDGTVRLKCRPHHESQVYRMGNQHDAFAHLAEVACPVTVATGVELPFGPSAVAPLIAERLPHGTLESHHDLGHFGPLEDPARIAGCIGRALLGA